MSLIDAETAVLDQRTAAPCCAVVHWRPVICSLVEDVLRIEERKQRVHIEQVPIRSVCRFGYRWPRLPKHQSI